MKNPVINIFDYLEVSHFLKDYYLTKKEMNSSFSYRQFAQVAQIPSGLYQDIVVGRRKLSVAASKKIAKAMKLNQKESEYLLCLALFEKAKTNLLKNEIFNQIGSLRSQAKMKFLDHDYYEYYSQWYHSIIRLLVSFKEFQESPQWIVEQLDQQISIKEAKLSLELLENLKLVQRDTNGKLILSEGLVTSNYEVNSLAIRNFNLQMIEKAKEAIEKIPLELREISGLNCSVSKQGFEKIKEKTRRFKEEILEIATDDTMDPDQIFQLNLQLFPLINFIAKPMASNQEQVK